MDGIIFLSLLINGYWDPFPGDRARPGRDVDHSPPSSAEVKNEKELYLLSPQALSWHVVGLFYFTIIFYYSLYYLSFILFRFFTL
jgi:hypothetical protein